ncbi:MAG: hypothetical protein AB7S92_01690 [Parvibaculaceae bacterium]
MKYLIFSLVALGLAGAPARADEKVDAAIRALDALEADAGKLQGYCAIIKELFAAGEDDEKSEALEAKMEQYLTGLGPDYVAAWELGEDLAPGSDGAAKLDAAFERLEDKCVD